MAAARPRHRRLRSAWLACVALAVACAGCAVQVPEARFTCATSADCPSGFVCRADSLCYRTPDVDGGVKTPTCTPILPCAAAQSDKQCCEANGLACGVYAIGCGRTIDCDTALGGCSGADTCGGGGVPNQCGCKTRTASQACRLQSAPPEDDDANDGRADCGYVGDFCGGVYDCGTCAVGECVDNHCECTRAVCAPGQCGELPDGCGGTLHCGGCSADEVCGGGGPNRCGEGQCMPTFSADDCDAQRRCDKVPDGCGGVVDCGPCRGAHDTCVTSPGSGGVCQACVPRACGSSSGVVCGKLDDGCGEVIECGGCAVGQSCEGGQCVCPSCEDLGYACGTFVCGQRTVVCGSACAANEACVDHACACAPDEYEGKERNDDFAHATELSAGDNAGQGRLIVANTDRPDDVDWYRTDLGSPLALNNTGLSLRVSMTKAPTGSTYTTGMWFRCPLGKTEVECQDADPISECAKARRC